MWWVFDYLLNLLIYRLRQICSVMNETKLSYL